MSIMVKTNSYYEDITIRLCAIKDANDEWQDLTRKYGTKVAKELRRIAPSDPAILYDLAAIALIDDGMTEEQAVETVEKYSARDWRKELKDAKPIITDTIKKAMDYCCSEESSNNQNDSPSQKKHKRRSSRH